ncbi:hypothetical protein QFC19_008220 [Naganishia cerealis]|uniref:Uncharacterized protein n=1 Tax=Naganishia cerealis TaxID=610337 RepID=A0ACC2V450_9TREE|nr:hypothetical protein QFC19_008220 [Naganishia cerealis]
MRAAERSTAAPHHGRHGQPKADESEGGGSPQLKPLMGGDPSRPGAAIVQGAATEGHAHEGERESGASVPRVFKAVRSGWRRTGHIERIGQQ